MRVLELGAGLGLCAMTAAALGAEVIATERPGEALDFLRANLHMNDATTSSRVSVEALDWAHRGAAQKLLAKYGQPHLVLGSDLCYNRDTIVMLQETMSEVAVGGTQVHIFMAQDQESVPGGTSISSNSLKSVYQLQASQYKGKMTQPSFWALNGQTRRSGCIAFL
eukprot:CAMPEP_0114286384 /NCGR_PEP_ID=MMETSP0059-20121206/5726_1 /TAXON_ID=36894 /ORGANISM="Pyramimonas parkeae, Strain CCMP726" /LENGTH=165 /DNA_ID=CAMNT_0001407415 /DNA_START=81 /DNA_END=579 /DNA_ORIENTATION=+